MANKVFLNKSGFIEHVYVGGQTFQTIFEDGVKIMLFIDRLVADKKKVRILVNINKITKVSADSLLAAADALKSLPRAKMAIYGGRKLFIRLAELVVSATGKKESVKFFDTKTQAQNWLKNS
jgi:hypothetical protein